MKALLLLVMVTACAAGPQDMSGKMLIFPEESNIANVRIELGSQNINALTVCFRFITNLNRPHSLFSLATTQSDNHFLIFKDTAAHNSLDLNINNKLIRFEGLNYELNKWHSVCATGEAESGLGQLWFDGKNTVKMFYGQSQINQPIVVLGQEQDVYGGGFDIKQSFVGMMSDVHMWDHVLQPCKIQRYMNKVHVDSGNVLNWMSLTFQTFGRVLTEDGQCQMS